MFESSDSEIHTISTERVELCIFSKYFDLVAEETLLAATESALSLTVGELSTNVCIVLSDDATIKNLNRLHRGLDEVTDVLSFSVHVLCYLVNRRRDRRVVSIGKITRDIHRPGFAVQVELDFHRVSTVGLLGCEVH